MKIALLTNDAREIRREYDLPNPYFGTAPSALLDGFALLPELEVHVVACWQKPMPAPEKLAPNIWFHGLLVPKLGWLRTGYQGCIRAVRRKLQIVQPDIVHGQGTERDCSISAVHSRFTNVLTIHGNMRLIARVNRARPFSFEWLQARLESHTIPRSSGVVCITRYTQDAVRSLARATWVVPNAADASFFAIKPATLNPPLVLCVGQVCVRKNQNAFIRALDSLAQRLRFQVLFLSSPANDAYGKEFMELIAARSWCQFGGWASREDLKKHLARASFLALPSLEDNCPMVVIEAMAASVPVMAARVGGVPDLIEDNRTGLLFDPFNASDMASAVEQLLIDKELAARLAAAGKQEALARFHSVVIARQHLEIYREVLTRRS
ncbi:MAG TPA: glycosyltransferase family 4 protein [Candidatus Limnocylindria bacterium]|nr:glycosyltransferase family 4 protein [Candidatus Limnocylindria bacterium]